MSHSSFAELNLSDPVLRALSEMGFEEPTPVQEQCIPHLMQNRDVVGQAQTGTGKTAAFGIPMIEQVDIQNKNVQMIVQCPTRELAIQVTGELIKIGQFMDGLHVVPVYGGQPISRQIKALKRGAQIVVGTPGRTIDHLRRGTLKLDHLNTVVFDEADEMLNMGFRDDMEQILSYADQQVQMVMFSATVSKAIRQIMKRYMKNPETVTITREEVAAPNIEQYVMEVRDSVRTEAICRVMDINDFRLALVFCNTKRKTEKLSRDLQARGYGSDVINGDLNQNQRDRVMNKFRRGDIDILVATDVAARGIDVDDIDVVFNYDIPQDPEYYVHRIGRTGRAGRSGTAITFKSGRKNKQLRTIQRQIKSKLIPMPMPSAAEVQESKMAGYLENVVQVLEKGGLRPFIEQIESIDDNRFTTIEIAAALLKMNMGTVEDGKEASAGVNGNTLPADDFEMVRLHFNIGKKQNVYPGDIVGAVTGETGIPGKAIGNIDIHPHHSHVDVISKHVPKVVDVMTHNRVKGKKVKVHLS